MKISELRVANFRNIEFANLNFSGNRIFFYGENGQGKTNLLETCSLLTALRSFRSRDIRLLIQHGKKEAKVAFTIDHENEGETKLLLNLSAHGGKSVELGNGLPLKKLGEFVGRFPVVVFSSDDIALVRGAPIGRRRWLDVTLSASVPGYLNQLQRYYQSLSARNKLLKTNQTLPAQYLAFEKILAESGEQITSYRTQGLKQIAEKFTYFAEKILSTKIPLSLDYLPNIKLEKNLNWQKFFEEMRATDFIFRTTQKGPHRDDFCFKINGKNADNFASEGQQRGLALALSLAQLSFFREKTGIAPVILADDVLNELDPQKRDNFWREVDNDLQIIATGTILPNQPQNWEIFKVSSGIYTKT